MFCLHCGHKNTKVTNSRPHKKRATIWRRRFCPNCESVFTTTEMVTDEGSLQVKNGANTEDFSVPKLLVSLYPHLSHRDKAADHALQIAQTIYESLLAEGTRLIETSALVSSSYEVLERFDRNGALKYALQHGMISLPSRQRRK